MRLVYNSIFYIAYISFISVMAKLLSPAFYFIFLVPTFKYITCDKHKNTLKILFVFFLNLVFFAIFFFWFIDLYGMLKFLAVCVSYALLFVFPFFILLMKRIPYNAFSLSFICTWIVIEYTIIHTDLLPPFFILGNTLHPLLPIIQFYEYTGVFGGTLWILIVNCMVFNLIIKKKWRNSLIIICLTIIIPVLLSKVLINRYQNLTTRKIDIGALHLNNKTNNLNDLNEMKKIINDCGLNDLSVIVFPENALSNYINIKDINKDLRLFYIRQMLHSYPFSSLIIGADLVERKNALNLPLKYNAGIVINNKGYHVFFKQKFVPFDENIPSLFRFFSNQSLYYHTKNDQKYYCNSTENIGVAICYEILYGNYVASQICDNVSLLTLLTKESGLKENTLAKKQYLGIVQIRSVEMRKAIIKSSTKGFTAIIGITGEVLKILKPTDPTQLLKGSVELYDKQTFYTRFGDMIPKISILIVVFILCHGSYMKIKNRPV